MRAGADLGYDAIVVKTDNKNVVNAHNDWMGKWRSNGWRNCRGKPVVNRQICIGSSFFRNKSLDNEHNYLISI